MNSRGKSLYVRVYIHIYHGLQKPTCLEVFMVNNLVFRWPKPLFFMVLGARGIYIYIYLCIYIYIHLYIYYVSPIFETSENHAKSKKNKVRSHGPSRYTP